MLDKPDFKDNASLKVIAVITVVVDVNLKVKLVNCRTVIEGLFAGAAK